MHKDEYLDCKVLSVMKRHLKKYLEILFFWNLPDALTFAYGSSACGCSDDLRAVRFDHFYATSTPETRKPCSDVQVISAIFYLFVYDSRLAGQF